MSSPRPRPGGPEDAERAARLFQLCLRDTWPADSVRRSVEERGGRLLLIEDEHGLAGALLLRAEAGEAEVLLVAVHPQRRGLGHGRALLRSGEAAAIEAGAGRCFLEVRAGNVAALGLYESEGYERVGCRPGYYGDGEDAFVLARDLGSQPLPGS